MNAPRGPDAPARSVVVVGNVRSRRTTELFSRALAMLAARGVRVLETHAAREGAELVALVERAVRAGSPYVLVAGGDGSMTSTVGAFAHRETVLGVLPLGTGNSFAQTLGIAPTIEAAIETIVRGRVRAVDLGVVNGRHFANFATIGLSSTIARNTPDALKKVLGPVAYAAAGVAPMLRSAAFGAAIAWDGGDLAFRTHQLIVANGRYFGFTPILPEASIVDGALSLFTTRGCSRWDVARMFVAMHRGRQTTLEDAEFFSARAIDVTTTPDQALDIDGEAFGTTPARFSVDRSALRVLVPQEFTGTSEPVNAPRGAS